MKEPLMASQDRQSRDRIALAGVLTALAVAVHVVETFAPTPVPWFRVGMANCFVLVALERWGFREAAWVAFGKVVLAALFTGRFLSPSFVLSLCGTGASLAVMAAAAGASKRLGFVGISVLGAGAHTLAQLCLAAFLFLRTSSLFGLLPLLGGVSLAGGVATGLVAALVFDSLERSGSAPIRRAG